jgi:hypothetical protein
LNDECGTNGNLAYGNSEGVELISERFEYRDTVDRLTSAVDGLKEKVANLEEAGIDIQGVNKSYRSYDI